ncbi:hypothetical protein [Pseudomonas putida]|uniref:hypothetical protein n=1 Tax=Pseudomonas putida TaxID=303 RepID=UPI0006491138|nr:hypothetical protein [Pseudomonas putida]
MMHGERSIKSIRNVYALLQRIFTTPEKYGETKEWLSVLATQASLAEYTNEELGIRGCAINTFRNSAKKALPNGFDGLNKLRKEARGKLVALFAEAKAKKPRGRRSYEAEIAALNARVDAMARDFMQMEVVVHKLRYIARQLATDDHIRDREMWWLREMRQIDIIYEGVVR